MQSGDREPRVYALVLSMLGFLFLLRVLGQVLVAFFNVAFLPPMTEWYSGLLPYHLLLPIQIGILILLGKVCADVWKGSGFFVVSRRAMGRPLGWVSYLYFAAMLVRYGVTMVLYPERRWFGGAIPIFFHWVLAAYLFVFSRLHTTRLLP